MKRLSLSLGELSNTVLYRLDILVNLKIIIATMVSST